MLKPTDIIAYALAVLKDANKGKYGVSAKSLTAYIILERLRNHPALDKKYENLRDQLIAERGMPGKGSGVSYSAASVVSDACEMLAKGEDASVAIEYADCQGERYEVAGQIVEPGYSGGVCGRYRAI